MSGDKEAVYAEFSNQNTQSAGGTVQKVRDQLNPANHSILENALAAVVFVLFVLVIVLAATHGSGGGGQLQQQQCSSEYCLSRSAHSVALSNRSVSPCQNFHSFACGNFGKMHQLDASVLEKTVFTELERMNRDRVEALLLAPIRRNSNDSFERKVKSYFQKCNDDFETEKLQGLPLALELSSGLYVLDPSTVNSFQLDASLQKIYAGLAAPALFEFYVMPNMFNDNLFTISIDSGGLGMNSFLYLGTTHQQQIEAYKQYMRLVAEALAVDWKISDADLPNRIDQFVQDVIEIETRLANITRTTPSPNGGRQDAKNMVTLSEMDSRFGPVKWSAFFAAALNNKVQPDTKVAVQSPDYLLRVMEYFGQTLQILYPADYKRKQSNYLNWRAMQYYAGELSSKYVHAKREFEAALSFRTYRYEPRFDYCLRRVQQYMQKAVSAMYVQGHAMEQARKVLDDMYKTLQQQMVESVDRIQWFDSNAIAKAKAKLKALRDRLAYFENEVTDSFLDKYYSDLNIEGDDYHMIMSTKCQNFQRRQQGNKLGQRPDPNEWDGATYDVNLHLNNPNVEITVPAGLLHWPVFSSKEPQYITYASVGSMIAAELIKAIDSSGHFYDENGNSQSWWSEEMLLRYVSGVNCTKNYFASMRAGPYVADDGTRYEVEIKDIIDRNLRNLVAAIDGLRLARVSYARKFGSSELPLPLSGMTDAQAFYVAWAQNHCYTREAQYSFLKGKLQQRLPEEILVNGALSLMPEFAAAFQCPASSPMVNRQCGSVFYN